MKNILTRNQYDYLIEQYEQMEGVFHEKATPHTYAGMMVANILKHRCTRTTLFKNSSVFNSFLPKYLADNFEFTTSEDFSQMSFEIENRFCKQYKIMENQQQEYVSVTFRLPQKMLDMLTHIAQFKGMSIEQVTQLELLMQLTSNYTTCPKCQSTAVKGQDKNCVCLKCDNHFADKIG